MPHEPEKNDVHNDSTRSGERRIAHDAVVEHGLPPPPPVVVHRQRIVTGRYCIVTPSKAPVAK